ncbi:major facilitator superfamily domain-containing protein [Lipomyces oligophaga]|uniref:major facilitator superfamily domain-containing protein n=1 Tax=Lipomyces oligophaga TaxID=45792 RepID=UPI0034CDDA76
MSNNTSRASSLDGRDHGRSSLQFELANFHDPLETEKFIVTFDGPKDPYSPLNWPVQKKIYTTAVYALCTFGPQMSSSIYGSSAAAIAEQFQVSELVSLLGVTLFLVGVGLGPMFFAPVSELYGRKLGVILPLLVSGLFALGCGFANSFSTILACRFFQGFFGGAPVANTGGVLGDIWKPRSRAFALVGYSFVVTGGPAASPLIGAAFGTLGQNIGWRWSQWFSAIYLISVFLLAQITVSETYHPLLLTYKARRLREETGNDMLHSRLEEVEVTLSKLLTKHFMRPFAMLTTPIIFLMSLYAAFVFGVLYLGVVAVPIAFLQVRHWSAVVSTLPTLGIILGIATGGVMNILGALHYGRVLRASNGTPIPEERLQAMKLGSLLMPAGLVLFGWTSGPNCFWIFPVIGLILLAAGFTTIFQGALNYLLDAFPKYAASVVAATTFLRSITAAGFPILGHVLFDGLGVDWGASVIALAALIMVPIPFVFFYFGKGIRRRAENAKCLV